MLDCSGGRKKKRLTLIASPDGLEKSEKALLRLGFESKSHFAKSQLISPSSVSNFFNRKPIQLDTFKRICEGLTLEWQDIAGMTEENINKQSKENKVNLSSYAEVGVEPVKTLVRQITVLDNFSQKINVEIKLKGDIDSIQNIQLIASILRQYGGNTIKIIDIQEGSIKLILEGSQEDINRLLIKIESGELTEIDIFPIESTQIESIQMLSEDSEYEGSSKEKRGLIEEIINNPTIERNLENVNLSDADLSRANLSRANLSGADLSDANLSDANLSDANLSRANLSDANLSRDNLSDADLSNANLIGANLSNANLSNANLSNASLIGANLSNANLSNANLSNASLIGANLFDANLIGANLSNTSLSKANLSGANLSDANLSDANLSDASLLDGLSDASLIGANLFDGLSTANLFIISVIGANLFVASLSTANLSDANLRGANLRGVDLSDANLINADLRGANLINADLRGADLRGADLRGASVERARFSSVGYGNRITEDLKQDLIKRGAIFEDSPGDRSSIFSGSPQSK